MSAGADPAEPGAVPGILASLRSMAGTFVALLQTRVELLSTELQVEAQRVVRLLVYVLAAAFFAGLSVLMLGFTVIVIFWDGHRVLASCLVTAAFAGIAVAVAVAIRRDLRRHPRFLPATRDELRRDVDALSGGPGHGGGP